MDAIMPILRIRILTGPAKGQQHRFDRFPVVIGRSPYSSLALIGDERISRAHARIRQVAEGLILEDLQSKNGTYVDETRLSAPLPLTASKGVRLGQTKLQLEIEGLEIERAGLPAEMKGPRQLVEAVVVLDLCDSTIMANRYGDTFALQVKEATRALVRPILVNAGVAFLKGTGDGFLATFPDLRAAAQAAVRILQTKDVTLPKASDGTPPMFRIGIHFGPTNVDSDGDRQGDVVNIAFRLEGVNVSGFHETRGGIVKDAVPAHDRIFVSEHAHEELQKRGGFPTRLVGFFDLKGISGRHRVFEILWQQIPTPDDLKNAQITNQM
jgi:class 3 adenylate cyclase